MYRHTVRSDPSFLNFEPGEADLKPNIYRFRDPACLCKVCQNEKFWQEVEKILIPLYNHRCYHEEPYPYCPECLEEQNAIEAIERKYNYLAEYKTVGEDEEECLF